MDETIYVIFKDQFDFALEVWFSILKTKIIVFRNSGIVKQTEKWYNRGEEIEVVPVYKYNT